MGRLALRLAAVAAVLLALALPAGAAPPGVADEGWTIVSFAADIQVQADASLALTERIDVDFGAQQKHGIFRRIPVRYDYDATQDRVYRLTVRSIGDGRGGTWPHADSDEGAYRVVRIGDAARTVNGRQTYVIAYTVQGALNPFADHDELYWNANGFEWPAQARAVSATATLPKDGITTTACFEGPYGATASCRASGTRRSATFAATRALAPGEGLTVGVSMDKGVVAAPPLFLEPKPRGVAGYFDASAPFLGGAAFLFLAGLALVGTQWYAHGRDRVYLKDHYLTNETAERVRPLFGAPTIVPEYEPPEKLRPAEVGLLLDERADPKDVTATIVDLARRGYLTIAEVPKTGLFGHADWTLAKAKPADAELAPYERTILEGLFGGADTATVSSLRGHFYTTLSTAQRELYRASVGGGWFLSDPDRARLKWLVLGVLVVVLGAALAFLLGAWVGGGLLGIAVALVGLALVVGSRSMAARTAKGSELLRGLLGFRMYLVTAELDRAKFAEKEGLFSDYLPYAIVFGCVEKWAKAFEGLDIAKQTAGWYVGAPLNAVAFSHSLSTFSTGLGTAVVATPGGRGGSFGGGGGFSGGGGGGGGGGSW